jgi:hypothetical protein
MRMEEEGLVRGAHLRGASADLRAGFEWLELDPAERRNWVEYDNLVPKWVFPWLICAAGERGQKED